MAGGAAAAATPDMLMSALRKVPAIAREAAPAVAREAAPAVAAQAVRGWTPELIKAGIARHADLMGAGVHEVDDTLTKLFKNEYKTPEEFENYFKSLDTDIDKVYDNLTPDEIASREAAIDTLSNYPDSEIEKAVKEGKVPKEMAEQGIDMTHLIEVHRELPMSEYKLTEELWNRTHAK